MFKMTALTYSFFLSLSAGKRFGLAFLLGALAGLAFPPFNAIPVLWLSFPGLVLLLRENKNLSLRAKRSNPESLSASLQRLWIASALKGLAMTGKDGKAFLTGWFFAFGLLIVCLHWIAGALFVDIETFWWVLPLAVAGLPALFAIYYGLAALAAARYGLHKTSGVFFFALCWFLADVARGHLFTGFPWDMTGYVWGDVLPMLQITSVIGIEGLTLLTLFWAVLPAAFFVAEKKRSAILCAILGFAVMIGLGVWGQLRLSGAETANVPDVRLRLVQPNIEQSGKWEPSQRYLNLEKLLDLSFTQKAEKPVTHFIWPETATAFYLTEEPGVRREIAQKMPSGASLLTGVVRRGPGEGEKPLYYNSLIVMDSKGNVVGGYDKHHLVPFGEYMPWRSVIPFRVITALGTDFTPGQGVRSLRAAGLPPFSPLVCYEAIFTGEVAARDDPPAFLLNVTNDAWYEGTIGPAQHFAIARVRAIEEGLPLVRVANKGITGVVDPYGRVTATIGEKETGFVDADLPQAIAGGTIQEKQKDRTSWLMFAVTVLVLLISQIPRK